MAKFKVGDRVKRLAAPNSSTEGDENGTVMDGLGTNAGCQGVVKAVREETSGSSGSAETKSKALMYQVLWDNGTLSYMGPDRLALAA